MMMAAQHVHSTGCLASAVQIQRSCHRCFRPVLHGKALSTGPKFLIASQTTLCKQSAIVCKASADPSEDRTSYRLIEVTLRKPMGLVLGEAKDSKAVFIEEVVKGGNAEQSGQVKVGDVVSKCSATVLKAGKGGEYEKEGYGQRPYDNWEKVMFDCNGEDFDTVMAAIGSNTERWGIFTVSLVLKRYISSDTPA